MNAESEAQVRIGSESDIVTVRKAVREAASSMGFGMTDVTRIVTAASELARNVYHYAGSGLMRWHRTNTGDGAALVLVFMDQGPGIPDIEEAMEMGFTTRGGLGLGLPGAKRLMDEMKIQSSVGKGTIVTVTKWKRGS